MWKARLCPQGIPLSQLYNSILVRKRFLGFMEDKVNTLLLYSSSGSVPDLVHADPGKGLLDRARYRLQHVT